MNTSLHDLMNTVESIEFDANMSVFSGFNSFLRALSKNETIIQLKQLLVESPIEHEILAHLINLLGEDVDPQFAHPKDVPIAAYLYVLSFSKEFPLLAIEKVLQTPNLTWAKRLAETMMANQSLPT
jgi:hypothetical protein